MGQHSQIDLAVRECLDDITGNIEIFIDSPHESEEYKRGLESCVRYINKWKNDNLNPTQPTRQCCTCGHRFDAEKVGEHGCPNCCDNGLD